MKQSTPPEQQAGPTGPSPEPSESRALTKRQAARRRLLGASLGTPLIYTLPSGANEAASSSRCEYRDESTEPFADDETAIWGEERDDGFVSDGSQWVSGSCWSSMQMDVTGSFTKIV
jgi:hypothetical protein